MDKAKLLKEASTRPPRFGGYLKIKKEQPPTTKFTSQLRRQLMDLKNTHPIVEAKSWNLDKDSQEMLFILISFVMKLASKKLNVSNKQLDLFDKYLRCIKYKSSYDLPNVNGILNYLSMLRDAPKPLNQIGDYTYSYKHTNNIYCALRDVKGLKRCPNLDFTTKEAVLPSLANYSNYMSKLEMTMQNYSYRKLH
ncbi:hypothetical protein FQR65_LT08067 [Abscondita terminalis]|nr:hypothetical protein FQR65_LT08067 [Abscondita terminalis]